MSTNLTLDSIMKSLLAALLQIFAASIICDFVDGLVEDLFYESTICLIAT